MLLFLCKVAEEMSVIWQEHPSFVLVEERLMVGVMAAEGTPTTAMEVGVGVAIAVVEAMAAVAEDIVEVEGDTVVVGVEAATAAEAMDTVALARTP